VPVTLDDLLASRLGRQGDDEHIDRAPGRTWPVEWDTTLAEVFPELAQQMDPDFSKGHLVAVALAPRRLPPNLVLADFQGDDAPAVRLRALHEETAKKPQHTPGSTYEYSNLGYIVAGAVVEKNHRAILGTGNKPGSLRAVANG